MWVVVVNLNHFFEDMMNATNTAEAFGVLEKSLEDIGFDRVRYDLITDHKSINKKAGFAVLRNYPDQWMNYYAEKSYDKIDPVCQYLVNTPLPFRWSDLSRLLKLSKEQQKMMQEAQEANLHNGVGLGIHSGGFEIVGMGFASSTPIETDRQSLHLISTLSHQFHNVFCELNAAQNEEQLNPVPALSHMEKEVLKWAAAHKTNWEIAQIIKNKPISKHTVDTYFRRIFKKLGVKNRTALSSKFKKVA